MIYSGYIDNYKQYSNFTSVKDFNTNIEMFLAENKANFTKSEYIAFKFLTKFCVKVIGVANGRIGTILKAMHDKFGEMAVSRSTFIRMIRRATELGILTVHETIRAAKGGQGHNVYQFNRFDTPNTRILTHRTNSETSSSTSIQDTKEDTETINLSNTNNQKDINKRIEAELDYTYTSDYVPKPFRNLVKSFYNEAKTIEEYWRMAKVCAYDYRKTITEADYTQIAIDAFKQMISKVKKGQAKKPIALYTGIFKNKIDNLFMDIVFNESI